MSLIAADVTVLFFIKQEVLLPGISIAIVCERISNADLSTIDPIVATVSSVGDGDGVDFMRLLKVQSPPWFCL